jgi:bifunctional DNA-binding transcriptional regulator/antitoxin component of YhaV-PrlF toxin-antitoxin module
MQTEHRVRLSAGGRLVIPAGMRQALQLEVGDDLVLSLDGKALRVTSVAEAALRAQALVRRYVDPERSLADELIEERARELRDA